MAVARGLESADTYITGGRVVNVYSGEVIPQNVAIWGGRIAYLGSSEKMVGPRTEVMEADGFYLVPGFIDPHAHLDILYNPTAYGESVLATGTTTVFNNSWDLSRTFTAEDYRTVVKALAEMPLRVVSGIPAEMLAPEFGEDIDLYTQENVEKFLALEESFGLAEIGAWKRLVEGDLTLLRKIEYALSLGKTVEGHTAGCKDGDLNAAVAGGLCSCHEAITAQEALDRLRLGFWVLLRNSSLRPDLPALAKLVTEYHADCARVMLTPDGWASAELLKKGYVDHTVREAIRLGVPPITAIQMVTRNPATYHGLDREIGGIAPGRYADIVFVRDLEEPRPEVVLADGKKVAQNGQLLVEFPEPTYLRLAPNKYLTTPRSFVDQILPELFDIAPFMRDRESFPVMNMVNTVISMREDVFLSDWSPTALLDAGLTMIALIDVEKRSVSNGLIKGIGAKIGGLAFSMSSADQPTVIGNSCADMAMACRRMFDIGGGIVVAEEGHIEYELPLTVGGKLSSDSTQELWNKLEPFFRLLADKGYRLGEPYYFLNFLTLSVVPRIKTTPLGIVDVWTGEVLVPARPMCVH